MMTPIEKIIAYVGGEIPLKQFYDDVMVDLPLQELLEEAVSVPAHSDHENLFLFMMHQNAASAGADLDIRDAMSGYLTALGIEHRVDAAAGENFGIVLDAAPSWLVLPGDYIGRLIEAFPPGASRAARLKMAKARIAEDFRCLKKRPNWLQDAVWPFENSKPMVFVGQFDLADLRHDEAQLYVFVEANGPAVRTIEQSA